MFIRLETSGEVQRAVEALLAAAQLVGVVEED